MDSGKWWVALVEGIVAILLGLYLLFGGDSAAGAFALVAGIYVLVVGILELWRGRGTVSRYRGLIGVIVGALILVLYFVDIFNTPLDFTLFAIGMIIVGAIGLYASFFARSGRNFEWGPVLVNALLLLWGLAIFYFRSQNADLQNITGWILLAIGVVMIIWGYLSRNNGEPEVVTAPEQPTLEDIVDAANDDASDKMS
jgi:uncharacterized membrane protein HdeD (DUF308 family)